MTKMFENYERAKHRKMPAWAAPLLVAVLVGHAGAITGMWAKSVWAIEKLPLPPGGVSIGAAAPPPPPPPLKGGAKPKEVKVEAPKKTIVKDLVQPVKEPEKIDKNPQPASDDGGPGDDPNGDINGDINGVAGGTVGGVAGGVVTEAPPPPPPPAPPQNVAPNAVESLRTSGDPRIVPDDVTKTEIQRSGKNRINGNFKLCLNAGGGVQSVVLGKSTGFPAYDQKIQREMRTWRYRPFAVNGKPQPVCTSVVFIYSQK